MQEDFIHYLWKYGLFDSTRLSTTEGYPVEVLHPGMYHQDSGPDFQFARIRINQVLWVGHVEIHVKASDWFRHNHHEDPAYDLVILHVVKEADSSVRRKSGTPIPVIRLPINQTYLNNYHAVLSTIDHIPCQKTWKGIRSFEVENWIQRSGIERMQDRTDAISRIIQENRGGWEETAMQILFRGFGFGVNRFAFEQLAAILPVKVIRALKSNLFRLEALLFGQAGLIPAANNGDSYINALRAEYSFISRKYNLPVNLSLQWRYLRMRPCNFPTIRLAQLALLLHHNPDLITLLMDSEGILDAAHFSQPLRGYWKEHYHFGRTHHQPARSLGSEALNLLTINSTLPFWAYYANAHGAQGALVKWMEKLEELPPENNVIIRLWKGAGFVVPNGFHSQALYHLYRVYCQPRRCLHCRIGQQVVRQGIL